MNVTDHHRAPDTAGAACRAENLDALQTWQSNRRRIEGVMRESDDALRALCCAVRTPAVPCEATEAGRQVALLDAWQARRRRIEAALRQSDRRLLAMILTRVASAAQQRLQDRLQAARQLQDRTITTSGVQDPVCETLVGAALRGGPLATRMR